MDRLTIARPDDWHLHLRDGPQMAAVLPDTARRFARAIVMPNLRTPVRTTQEALAYRGRILAALPEGASFEPLMTLYLTDDTPPEEIALARRSGQVHAVKLYPAGATTHSDAGVTRISRCFHTLEKMEEQGMPLLVHGEVTDPEVDVFDREPVFIEEVLGPLVERFPGLKERLAHKGRELSGGEQQMLAIARALLTGPELLLLDEPSQGLAPLVVNAVMSTIEELKKERVSMLLVEQNAEMALRLADRVYVIDHGTVVFEGTPAALRADRQVTTTYLGVGG